jgi:hypothetical protein
VELFEEIRREYEFGVGTIKGVARKLGVHRRMVREAIANATPPVRRKVSQRPSKLSGYASVIDGILVLLTQRSRNDVPFPDANRASCRRAGRVFGLVCGHHRNNRQLRGKVLTEIRGAEPVYRPQKSPF